MRLKTILLIYVIVIIPIASVAEEPTLDIEKIESMNIESLIEKAKKASSDERSKIEALIKKKIAQAHRDNSIKG